MDKENVDIGELYISVNKYSKDDRYFRISLSFYNVVTTLKVKNTFIIPIHSDIGPQVVGNPILEITDKLKRNYRVKLDA